MLIHLIAFRQYVIITSLFLCCIIETRAQSQSESVYYDRVGDPNRRFMLIRTDSVNRTIPVSGTRAPVLWRGLNVQTFEDNYVGYTLDSDDEAFMDFKLSVAYQLSAFGGQGRFSLNFAFTGRFAQYIGTRESSPVVGKRFNPYLYFRYNPTWWGDRTRFRFGYAHESNGQSITDLPGFTAAVATLTNPTSAHPLSSEQATRQTLDQISRGWDYLGVSWTHRLFANHFYTRRPIQGYMLVEGAYRGYLKRGLMQGLHEEYQPWEQLWTTPGILHRSQVSGVNVVAEYFFVPSQGLPKYAALRALDHLKLGYTTGSSQPFSYHSVLLQAGLRVSRLRIAGTYTNGYDGDLAQYGKRNESWGISFILNSFIDPLSLTSTSR